MPEFAVSAAIRAVDKMSAVFHNMGDSLGKFGSKGEDAMDRVNKKASLFKTILGANIVGNLVTKGIEKVGEVLKDIPKQIEEFADRGEQLNRTSTIVGTSAETWQRLAYAAKMTDTSVDGLQTAMQKLNRGMAEMHTGKGPLMDIVKYGPPGLGKMMLSTHDAGEALLRLADGMQKIRDPQVRAAVAVAAFGKAGQDMIPFLLKGRAGIQELMKEADKYGSVLNDKTITASERVEETMKRLRGTIGSVKDQVLSFIVQAVGPYLEKATEWIADHKELIATKIQDFITKVADAGRSLAPVISTIIKVVSWLLGNTDRIIGLYLAWTAVQIALNIAMHMNPIGIITLAIEALIAVVILVVKHWKEISTWISVAWDKISKFAVGIYNTVIPYLKALGGTIMAYFLAPINLVMTGIVALLNLLSKLPGKTGSAFKTAADAVSGFQGAMNQTIIGNKSGNPVELWKNAIGGEQAPGGGRPGVNVTVPVNVDNSRAPGVQSNVRVAPPVTGYGGAQFAGAR